MFVFEKLRRGELGDPVAVVPVGRGGGAGPGEVGNGPPGQRPV